MILRETRIKIWYLIKKVAKKLNIVDIPKETEIDYWERMKLPSESVRYLLIDCYCLDTGFFYHSFEERDLKGKTIDEKAKEMFEGSFESEDNIAETFLLIDIKALKAYTITKEIKYTRKLIK